MGPRRSGARKGAGVALVVVLVGATIQAGVRPAVAEEPTTPPPGTCGDRYPADGPAGADLQLGCLLGEIVSHYTGSSAPASASPLSSYLPQIGLVASGVVALLVAGFLARRLLGRRLAPVLPATWWSCPTCHSVNAITSERCYRCGATRSSDAIVMETVAKPETPQAFGHDWRDD